MPPSRPSDGHGQRGVGERRAAELAEVYVGTTRWAAAPRALATRWAAASSAAMALAVLDRQGVGVEAFGAGDGEAGGGIEPAGQQDEGAGAAPGVGA
jgi:hypothetical protein